MGSELPPDPYLALGVSRDATSGAIKTSYRKLVLKFHPDKVQDETQKQAASDQFHKIQTAYEIIGDEDRRARYDAQCKLAELRKEVMEKQGSGGPRVEVRTAGYRMPTDSPGRTSFAARGPDRERVHVEERRPYDADYFDRPRASARKDHDYERSKRSSPRDDRDRVKVTRQDSKENERYRSKEKVKQTTRDTRRDRDYKQAYAEPASESDSDTDERDRRRRKQEDDVRRTKDSYYEQAGRPREGAQRGLYSDDHTKKMFSDVSTARDYIERSRGAPRQYSDPDRRPSPVRQMSTKDKVEYIRRSEGGRPAAMVRRGSVRPRTAGREAEESPRQSTREKEQPRRLSSETDEAPRRPPTLAQTKSAPEHIRIPGEARRSYSLQPEFEHQDKEFQAPPIRRADSMPQPPTTRRPQKPSTLRNTEINEGGLPTPSASPDSPTNPNSAKYNYRTEYADDNEYPTPDGYRTTRDGYRTEVREPASSGGRKITRSPSPIKEERARAASSRYPAASVRPSMLASTRTTSYMYTPQGLQDMPSTRPSLLRAESSRQDPRLYGEIPTTQSPRNRSKYSPPPEDVRYQREFRPEDIRYQTGYGTTSRRASEQKPSYSRNDSYSTPVY